MLRNCNRLSRSAHTIRRWVCGKGAWGYRDCGMPSYWYHYRIYTWTDDQKYTMDANHTVVLHPDYERNPAPPITLDIRWVKTSCLSLTTCVTGILRTALALPRSIIFSYLCTLKFHRVEIKRGDLQNTVTHLSLCLGRTATQPAIHRPRDLPLN